MTGMPDEDGLRRPVPAVFLGWLTPSHSSGPQPRAGAPRRKKSPTVDTPSSTRKSTGAIGWLASAEPSGAEGTLCSVSLSRKRQGDSASRSFSHCQAHKRIGVSQRIPSPALPGPAAFPLNLDLPQQKTKHLPAKAGGEEAPTQVQTLTKQLPPFPTQHVTGPLKCKMHHRKRGRWGTWGNSPARTWVLGNSAAEHQSPTGTYARVHKTVQFPDVLLLVASERLGQ